MADGSYTALSLRQPYAHLIVKGIKRYEARSWTPSSLGTVLIHASSSLATGWRNDPVLLAALAGLGMTEDDAAALDRGAIIGKVDVVDIYYHAERRLHDTLSPLDRFLCTSDGYTNGFCLWKLENPVLFRTPVVCKGALHLWKVPETTIRKVLQDNSL